MQSLLKQTLSEVIFHIMEVLFKFFKNGNTLIAGPYTASNLIKGKKLLLPFLFLTLDKKDKAFITLFTQNFH